jgi:hypothetical protein
MHCAAATRVATSHAAPALACSDNTPSAMPTTVAVIENEFGEIDIDSELVARTEVRGGMGDREAHIPHWPGRTAG